MKSLWYEMCTLNGENFIASKSEGIFPTGRPTNAPQKHFHVQIFPASKSTLVFLALQNFAKHTFGAHHHFHLK